ncbi:hypothetical protein [Thiocapsa bogorovii]|uniref:hypothetical protein n=1 Tax=Thiocapsa bogorovii TaxID=521689 RepID=UPI001E5E1CEC|nr:hypothetical protein [Thiocapsa bogorovii]UHD18790.1 hypothetical protein LT988_12455 [Thiocapsa bogorovii]
MAPRGVRWVRAVGRGLAVLALMLPLPAATGGFDVPAWTALWDQVDRLEEQLGAVSLMEHMLAVDAAIRKQPSCAAIYAGIEAARAEMKRLNADTRLSQSAYDQAFGREEARLRTKTQEYKDCFAAAFPGVAARYPDVLALGVSGNDAFEARYAGLKQPYYGGQRIADLGAERKRLNDQIEALLPKRLEDYKQWRDFRGMDDRRESAAAWSAWIEASLQDLVAKAHGYTRSTDVSIPGETEEDREDGIVFGYQKGALSDYVTNLVNWVTGEKPVNTDPGRLIQMLAFDDLAPERRGRNPYADWTAATEEPLRELILAAPEDSLLPADVMRMALKVSGGNYPLAVMTATAVLKYATKKGRDEKNQMVARAKMDKWRLIYHSAVALEPHADLALRLRNLRPAGDDSGDKLGPWYHGFGILAAGALSSPLGGWVGQKGEHTLKYMGSFVTEAGYNPNKAGTDGAFAAAAWALAEYNRYYERGPRDPGY